MSRYTSRRTFLLDRFAWGLMSFAVVFAIFGGEYRSWTLVIASAVLAILFWLAAGSIERKRNNKSKEFCDENGNIRPNKL